MYESILFDLIVERLVSIGYPQALTEYKYDPSFPARFVMTDVALSADVQLHFRSHLNYSLRNSRQDRQLPDRMSRLTDCNLIIRMLYHDDAYCTNVYLTTLYLTVLVSQYCGLTLVIKLIMLCYVMLLHVYHNYCCIRRSVHVSVFVCVSVMIVGPA